VTRAEVVDHVHLPPVATTQQIDLSGRFPTPGVR